jgi:hypothetical protein
LDWNVAVRSNGRPLVDPLTPIAIVSPGTQAKAPQASQS